MAPSPEPLHASRRTVLAAGALTGSVDGWRGAALTASGVAPRERHGLTDIATTEEHGVQHHRVQLVQCHALAPLGRERIRLVLGPVTKVV